MGETALISLFAANGLAAFFTLSYVGCLYVSQHTRVTFSARGGDNNKDRPRTRDDPEVIRARLIAVSISTLSSYALLYYIVHSYMPELSWVSIRPRHLYATKQISRGPTCQSRFGNI